MMIRATSTRRGDRDACGEMLAELIDRLANPLEVIATVPGPRERVGHSGPSQDHVQPCRREPPGRQRRVEASGPARSAVSSLAFFNRVGRPLVGPAGEIPL